MGINTIILPGVTIGDDVIIGAGSVVTRDIPSGSVAAGVPARVLKSTDEYFFQSKEKSLGLGHLPAAEKELALREFFKDFIGPQ